MRTSSIHRRSLVSVIAALCLLSVPFGLAGADGADTSPPVDRIRSCWVPVDPIPVDETTDTTVEETVDTTTDTTTDTTVDETTETTDTTDTTETTDTTDTTDTTVDETTDTTSEETTDTTTIDRPLPYPCWYGPIHPYCWNWPRIHIDPPVTTPQTTDLPPVDEPSEPTYTIEPDEPPFRDEPTEPTYTIEPQEPPFIEEPLPSKLYCFKRLPSEGPLGVSEDGTISITGISPDVLPADDSYESGLITIYGTGFRAGSTVMIGDDECTAVDVIDEFTLSCDPPTGEISVRDVIVIDPDGNRVAAPAAFEFADPAGFWELPLYAFGSNPLERSTTVEDSATDEDLAASGTSGDVAVPVFTG